MDERNWDCFVGEKLEEEGLPKVSLAPNFKIDNSLFGKRQDLVDGKAAENGCAYV